MFAIAMAGYDGYKPFLAEEDPSIGSLEFVLNSYNATSTTGETGGYESKLMGTKICDEKDLNNSEGSNDESYFYKLRDRDELLLDRFRSGLKCLKRPEELEIYGDLNSLAVKNLQI